MKTEQFEHLVARLEPLAARRPTVYRIRLALLAGLGYAVLFGSLIVLIAICALIVGLAFTAGGSYILVYQLLALFGGLAIVILRSLWIRIKAPRGLLLTRSEAAPLFDLVERIRASLQCPPVNHIVMDSQFNAAIASVPRFGILVGRETYLVVGLPLMLALSPDQFHAVLAHELGHLSRHHDRFGHWIYRVGKSWFQLLAALEASSHKGARIFAAFFNWYAPYFFAYAYVLNRAVEYEADRSAAELTGAHSAAGALASIEVTEAFLREEFWPGVLDGVKASAEPPSVFRSLLPTALQKGIPEVEARQWLNEALKEETGSSDTHPALPDRLRALGETPDIPHPLEETAARRFLGDRLPELAACLDLVWRQQVAHSWRSRHNAAMQDKDRLRILSERAEQETFTVQDAFDRARLVEQYVGVEKALPLYREVLSRDSDHAEALYHLGRALLSQKNPEGIQFLERAMDLEEQATLICCELIHRFLEQRGESDRAAPYFDRGQQFHQRLEAATQERAAVTGKDRLIPHGLSKEALQPVLAQLSRRRQVGAAYLARKELHHWPEQPLFVLALKEKFSWNSGDAKQEKKLAAALSKEIQLPGDFHVVVLPSSGLQKRLDAVPGARIYPIKKSL